MTQQHDGLAQEVHHYLQEHGDKIPFYHYSRLRAALADEMAKVEDCPEPTRADGAMPRYFHYPAGTGPYGF